MIQLALQKSIPYQNISMDKTDGASRIMTHPFPRRIQDAGIQTYEKGPSRSQILIQVFN